MNSATAELMNLPTPESPRADSCNDVTSLRARWQTAVETVSGYASQKLRLDLTRFHNYSPSTHGSNDNDRSINIVRPSHLPVSA
jgi:hypothetical protein